MIYVHGYQSYIWNRAVSERLRRFGRKVLVGDLAVRSENADLLENAEIIDEAQGGGAATDNNLEESKEESKEAA